MLNLAIETNGARYTIRGATGNYMLNKKVFGEVKKPGEKAGRMDWHNAAICGGASTKYMPRINQACEVIASDCGARCEALADLVGVERDLTAAIARLSELLGE